MRNQLFVQATIKEGKLHFPIKAFESKYNNFLKEMPEGARIELFIGVQDGKGSNPQLARVHAMIREIANEKARIISRNLVDEWHLQNSNWDDKTWSPRLIGNRLSNILFCYGTFADTADNEFQNRLMKQFASQARYLELEWKNFENHSDRLYALLGLMSGRVCLTKQKKQKYTN